MTKVLKELCVVILLGAGTLFLMWGLMNQVNMAPINRPPVYVSRIMWDAVWMGTGIIVASVALAIFVKPTK